jgi:hypothetical protein
MNQLARANGNGAISPQIGNPQNAQRFTVNLSAEIGDELRQMASEHQVSESSIVEVALRQLFLKIDGAALGTFLRERGACLRRR